MATAGARLAIRLLQDAAVRGELDPWDVDVIAVVDGFLDQLRQRIEVPRLVAAMGHGGSYEQDLAECREYSKEVQTGKKVATGAASGAVVGGLIGAITGDPGKAAGVGAVGGGARGANEGAKDEVQVVKNCLRGRGYRILN